jgi:23S rRNA (adenine2503-C2)-methyltransferase
MNDITKIPLGEATVIKDLIELSSGHKAEAIYYNRPDKQVICLSTQLSCAVGCVFCASPDGNKTVNLSMLDMLEQIAEMDFYAEDDKIMLFSFMGEGEPMQNYASLID